MLMLLLSLLSIWGVEDRTSKRNMTIGGWVGWWVYHVLFCCFTSTVSQWREKRRYFLSVAAVVDVTTLLSLVRLFQRLGKLGVTPVGAGPAGRLTVFLPIDSSSFFSLTRKPRIYCRLLLELSMFSVRGCTVHSRTVRRRMGLFELLHHDNNVVVRYFFVAASYECCSILSFPPLHVGFCFCFLKGVRR